MILSIDPIHFISVRMSSLIIARPELKNTIKVLKYARKVRSFASFVLSIASLSVSDRDNFFISHFIFPVAQLTKDFALESIPFSSSIDG